MFKKTAFICFFPIFPNNTGSSEVINARFHYWPGKKKLFQLSNISCKKNNIETVNIFFNLPIFKILFLPFLILKILKYLKKTEKKNIVIEGASWIFYSFFVIRVLKFFFKDAKFYYFSHSIESEIRKKFSNKFIYFLTFILEKEVFKLCDFSTSVSLKEILKIKKLYHVDTIFFPNSINLKKIKNKKKIIKKKYIIYSGSYLYRPNQDAINYLNNCIMPKLALYYPDIKLVITGGGYTGKAFPWLINKNIVSKGSLYNLIFHSQCMCLPIKYGSGTRIKILESLCLGGVIVSSKIGIEGIKIISAPPFVYKNDVELISILFKIIKNYKNIKKQSYANRNFYLKNYLMSENIKKFVKKYVE